MKIFPCRRTTTTVISGVSIETAAKDVPTYAPDLARRIPDPTGSPKRESLMSDFKPGLQGVVKRAQTVVVKGFDENGKPLRLHGDGYTARVIQHEVDHLDGILYIDRMDTRTLCSESLSGTFGPAAAAEDADV